MFNIYNRNLKRGALMSRIEIKEYILNNRESLVEKIMARQWRLMPELKEKYNTAMVEKTKSDTSYNLNYLTQAVFIDEKSTFSNYYNWLYTVLKERGIGIDVLKKHLLAISATLPTQLEESKSLINAVRENNKFTNLKIMVGGRLFLEKVISGRK
ncbi:hypothetical protein DFR79_12545 [Halanaerobium saccharolyticum]|uniref:Uncharacterized protein n=2 Tax=Halanaerobium saccharolyticum TaxID=43595 RepID=A0A4R6LHN2_9FIRM|nr:hypothetical protein DFR79_12545 [Halanaerobium saccharolyticum]